MVLRTDTHGVKCSVRDPVKERFIAVSGQDGGLQDGQVIRHIRKQLVKISGKCPSVLLPQFSLREGFSFSVAFRRSCVELPSRNFTPSLRVGALKVYLHVLHPDEIGVRFCPTVHTRDDALIKHPFRFAFGDMKQFIKLLPCDLVRLHLFSPRVSENQRYCGFMRHTTSDSELTRYSAFLRVNMASASVSGECTA